MEMEDEAVKPYPVNEMESPTCPVVELGAMLDVTEKGCALLVSEAEVVMLIEWEPPATAGIEKLVPVGMVPVELMVKPPTTPTPSISTENVLLAVNPLDVVKVITVPTGPLVGLMVNEAAARTGATGKITAASASTTSMEISEINLRGFIKLPPHRVSRCTLSYHSIIKE
jgi:hypothetical protein